MEPERQCSCHADEYAVGYAVGHLDGQAVGRAERDRLQARVETLEAILRGAKNVRQVKKAIAALAPREP